MRDTERLCVRTGAKPISVPVRTRTLPQDVVVPYKDAGMALYPAWRMSYAAFHMQPDAERSEHSANQPDAAVRMTVQEAAAALGVTVEAVRGRMHRGKYEREKTEDGRVFVLLTPDQLSNVPPNDRERFDQRSPEQSANGLGRDPDLGDHALVQELVEELAEELRQEVKFLRAEIVTRNEELRRREEEHREESRRKDHIIMSLTQRIPELEAAPEPRGAPETGSDLKPGVDHPQGGDAGAEGGVSRPWWRRLFGA